jgi:Na+-transporting methylmalonyl-CoA/oxaloacetate decarboxylase gamma subunit
MSIELAVIFIALSLLLVAIYQLSSLSMAASDE